MITLVKVDQCFLVFGSVFCFLFFVFCFLFFLSFIACGTSLLKPPFLFFKERADAIL